MSYKKVTFSWPSWVIEQYLHGVKNKSSFTSEMFIKGCDAELSGSAGSKSQQIQLMKENRSQAIEIAKLKTENARFKALIQTQQAKEDKKNNLARQKAGATTAKKILLETLEEGDHQ